MAVFNKFNVFTEDVLRGVHQLHAAGHEVKVYLSNAAPTATNTIKANVAEISAGNGYTAGGSDVQNDLSRTAGVTDLTGVDVTFTASGGTIGPFRYAVVYNDTVADDPLICWWDRGSEVTLQAGESFRVEFTGGVIADLT
jgi:hypothetical protein